MNAVKEQVKARSYRPDIDGLRAVAVLLVIADHIGTRATGGFVGVDVFFVISGYLISAHILADMHEDRFSFLDFYERRIRRIIPALLAMLCAVTVFAYLYYVPSELEDYGRSLLSAILSYSNMLFWHQAGYFDAPSKLKPLLHTWSLGVEEQFYIVFPIFLFAVRRWLASRFKAAIWTVFILSFVAAAVWVRVDSTAAFFFAPLRAWELLIGTVLSQRYVPTIKGTAGRNAASCVGLLLILVPAFLYTPLTVFPGPTALLPCVGAALIIAAGETGLPMVNRLLTLKPVVFIGAISYSLYLWHWPLVAFEHTAPVLKTMTTDSRNGKWLLVSVMFLLGALSWLLIEQPFRKGKFRPGRQILFTGLGSATMVVVVLALGIIVSGGLPGRYPAEANAISRYANYDHYKEWRQDVCFFTPDEDFSQYNAGECLKETPKPHFLLIGDSHAADLYSGLVAAYPGVNVSEAAASDCPPFVVPPKLPQDFVSNCAKLSRYFYQDYLVHHPVHTVILSVDWHDFAVAGVGDTVRWIKDHGMNPVVIGPTVEYTLPLPRILISSMRNHEDDKIASFEREEPKQLDAKMARLARDEWHVPYISFFDAVCRQPASSSTAKQPLPPSACPVYGAPRVPLLFDSNHFTGAGATLFATAMREQHLLPDGGLKDSPR
jgi:peptidoglycan/LPS O-acetylase OafA/YrhL